MITLRPYRDGDEEAVLALLTDPIIRRTFLVPDLPTPEKRHAMFVRLRDASRSPAHYERLIDRAGEVAGFVCDVAIQGSTIEVGYVVRTDLSGQGIATAALRQAINELRALGYRRVEAGAFAENAASFRVMEKCGLTPIPRKEDVEDRGRLRPCSWCALDLGMDAQL